MVWMQQDLHKKENFNAFKDQFEKNIGFENFSTASKEITRLLLDYPEHPGMLFLASKVYFEANELKQAKKYIEKALSYETNHIAYLTSYGEILIALEEFELARTTLEKALLIDPNHYELLTVFSYLEQKTNALSEALVFAEKAQQINPNRYEAYYRMGLVQLAQKGKETEALNSFKKARKLNSSEALAYEIASVLFQKKKLEESERICKKSIMKNPNGVFVEKFRALIRRIQHEEKEASPTESNEGTSFSENTMSKDVGEYMKLFQQFEKRTNQVVLGQANYVKALQQGFLRPYAFGTSKENVRNTMFVSGKRSMGGYKAIRSFAKQMHEKKLMKSPLITVLSLEDYSAGSLENYDVFLTDLYKMLKGESEVIIFEEIEKASPQILIALSQLIVTGKVKLKSRYAYQQGELIEIHGRLMQESFDEIEANGKYLVFSSEKDFNVNKSLLKHEVLETVKDIMHVETLSFEVLTEIYRQHVRKVQNDLRDQLQLTIEMSEDTLVTLMSPIRQEAGVDGVKKLVEKYIRTPIIETHMKTPLSAHATYNFKKGSHGFLLENDGEQIPLEIIIDQGTLQLEEVKSEIDAMIGLEEVKDFVKQLDSFLELEQYREKEGLKSDRLSMHMIFTGNPGTGKTTVARLIAKYLKALGYLSSGHLVEAGRDKLVAGYVGQTADKTQSVIESARGGVLFIDEAYSLARGNSTDFGKEAVDTLVKGMDDYRDDLVVIMAGYTDEMEDLLSMNPGMSSRINHIIEFQNYNQHELLKIAQLVAVGKEYEIAHSCEEGLRTLFEKRQIPGKNDAGNGRLARNVVEKAIQKQSNRLLATSSLEALNREERNTLLPIDFGLEEKPAFDLEEQLDAIIGLDEVKNFVRQLERQLITQEKRKAAGIKSNMTQSLHMIFTGNPGTGKTTVARTIAGLLREMNILKSGKVVETDQSGLVAEYVGQSITKTTDTFMSALGGVLIIDEAYALAGSSFGKEAVDTLVKLMEDHREHIIVILTGYSKEMAEFIETNSGLKSRFSRIVNFPDYTVTELMAIGKKMIESSSYALTAESEKTMFNHVEKELRLSRKDAGNGRFIRNVIEQAILNQNDRIALSDTIDRESLVRLDSSDFISQQALPSDGFDLETRLNSIIGLIEVKEFILSLKAQVTLQKEREKYGLPRDASASLHMLFTGNPGTGKTTMARIIGELFYELGILPQKNFVEVDRSGLVAGYVGQTALKTQEKIEEAMGGILFVDEAYTLVDDANNPNSFGTEAVNTILKAMEDHRDQLIVIFAGYTDEMERFVNLNPGLKSRLPNVIQFPDYDVHELVAMAEDLFDQNGYHLGDKATLRLKERILEEIQKCQATFDNGRFIRNLYEATIRNMALRLHEIEITTITILTEVIADDIK